MENDQAAVDDLFTRGFVPTQMAIDLIRERDRALQHDVATEDELRREIERRLGELRTANTPGA